MGPGDPRHHPDRLHDPRGSDFDSADQRLFQSEGLNGRMTVFTLPRVDYRVDLPARSQLAYESLDSQMSIGPQAYTIGHSELNLESDAEVVALSGHLLTRATMDADSERQSRVLQSEVVLDVSDPAESALFYVDTRDGRTVELSIVNGNDAGLDLQLELRTTAGETATELRHLNPDEQWVVDIGGTLRRGRTGRARRRGRRACQCQRRDEDSRRAGRNVACRGAAGPDRYDRAARAAACSALRDDGCRPAGHPCTAEPHR